MTQLAARWVDTSAQLFDTLLVLVTRELQTRYKGSFFGILWAILSPLGTVFVLEFVFGRVLVMNVPHFTSFIYSGLLPWIWFSTSVQTGATTLVENRDLVRTPFFASQLLPAIVTSTNFLLYVFALPVLAVLLLIDGVPVTSAWLALPAVWLVQALLTLAFTVFVAASAVLIRDIQHLLGVVLLLWFYVTPIFYSFDQVPSSFASWLRFNPMTPIVTAHRAVTLYGQLPNWIELSFCALGATGLLAVSLLVFRALEDVFVEEA